MKDRYDIDARGGSMNEASARQLLVHCGAVRSGHFVLKSGRHSDEYIAKDLVYTGPDDVATLCRALAVQLPGVQIDTVIGPEKGGIILAQWIAFYHGRCREDGGQTHAVFAEKNVADGGFHIGRGYADYVAGKKIWIVEDVLTTGGSVLKVVEAVRAIKGEVVGVVALVNRGAVTAAQIGNVPHLFSLVNISLESWPEEECPLCADKIDINTDFGHGTEFLSRRQAS